MGDYSKLYGELMHVSHFLRHGHGEAALKAAPGQIRVLTVLAGAEPMAQRDLIERLGIAPASLSELLTKLEERGLVARKRSKDDRRVIMLSLTAAGRRQADDLLEAERRAADEVFGPLTAADRKDLDRILAKIIASWEK